MRRNPDIAADPARSTTHHIGITDTDGRRVINQLSYRGLTDSSRVTL